jgi:carotenoid cleavage dioxygenase-like enzyme
MFDPKVYSEYMTNAAGAELPFHLAGAFAPVCEERTVLDLEVRGELPRELNGTYLRNGPNPRSGRSPAWFAAEGMLHGVRLEAGRARWYRNRWIAASAAPNTSVIRHAGRTLALVEMLPPVEVGAELETVGRFDFGGALAGAMTAHPKRCPRTGELSFFSQSVSPPHLTYYRADASGRVVQATPLDVPAYTFMHDFAITEQFAVFYLLPVVLGDFRSGVPFRWDSTFPARIGVLPRAGGNELRWFDVAPCTISHVVNAFEEADAIVLDAVRAARLMAPHALYRFRLDLRSGRATEAVLDPRFLDFPRVHPAVVGRRHRWMYSVELCGWASDGRFYTETAYQHDLQSGAVLAHDFGANSMPGECVVAPRPGSFAEDDAWVLLFVHREAGAATELVVLDAKRFAGPPVASVRIPGRVPFGLHGEWLADG